MNVTQHCVRFAKEPGVVRRGIVGAFALSTAASAQNVIEDVAVAKGAAGRTTLTFALKTPLAAAPSVFAIATPPGLCSISQIRRVLARRPTK